MGYECICNDGFEGDPNNYGCYEIATTVATTEGPTTPYVPNPDKECDQYLECGPSTHCHAQVLADDECHCTPGYEPGDPYDLDIGCIDIDECDPASGDNYVTCARNAHCVNIPGLWMCECDAGFEGDPNNYGCFNEIPTTDSTTPEPTVPTEPTTTEEPEPTQPEPTEPVPEVIGFPNFFLLPYNSYCSFLKLLLRKVKK